MNQTPPIAATENRRLEVSIVNLITITTFMLAGVCFYWYTDSGRIPLLLLGWVTFGTAFDFLSHMLGQYLPNHRRFLETYARINFAALCFGIPFTVLAASFVIAEFVPDGINAAIVVWWPQILMGSLGFGGLFLVAQYREHTAGGVVGFTLDKANPYTKVIFVVRRVYLAGALLLSVAVVVDGIGSAWSLWSIAFGLSFSATVPLHIMHWQVPSMLTEALTLYILAFGSWAAFVA